MRKLIPTLTLAAILALTTLCEAGSRTAPSAHELARLSNAEHLCYTVGQLAYDQARARDIGMSYLEMLTIVRGLDLSSMAPLETFIEANLRVIFADPRVTPTTTRNETEIVCMNTLFRSQQPLTTTAKRRY